MPNNPYVLIALQQLLTEGVAAAYPTKGGCAPPPPLAEAPALATPPAALLISGDLLPFYQKFAAMAAAAPGKKPAPAAPKKLVPAAPTSFLRVTGAADVAVFDNMGNNTLPIG